MADSSDSPDSMQSSTAQPGLSILAILRKLNIARLSVLAFILLVTLAITLIQPKSWIAHYDGSAVQMLTRIWILASILATFAVSLWIYCAFLIRIANDARDIQNDDRRNRMNLLNVRSGLLMVGIIVLSVIVGIMAYFVGAELRLINLLSGPILVLLITILDGHVVLISAEYVSEAESKLVDANTRSQELQDKVSSCCRRYQEDLGIVMRLDIPILFGISGTWILGYVVLANILGESNLAYAHGFATGATALQILVGNMAFEIIHASSGA